MTFKKYFFRRLLAVLTVLLLFSGWGIPLRLRAGDQGSSQSQIQKSDLEIDQQMDNGEDDDKEGENTETSKFKEDSDDTYDDTSMDQDGQTRSKFKEDQDEEDSDTDDSSDDQNSDS